MICFRRETGVCGAAGSAPRQLVNFLTHCFATPFPSEIPAVNLRQKTPGGRWYDEAVPTPLRDQADLQGPSHLGLLFLTVIYRDRVKWVCLAVGLFTGSVSFEFLLEKVQEMCGLILTVL